MHRLHYKLILAFLAATLIPTSIILWMSAELLKYSLSYAETGELEALCTSLEETARSYYRQSCDILKNDALAGRLGAQTFDPEKFPEEMTVFRQFWESGDTNRFALSEPAGGHLLYLVRQGSRLLVYSKPLDLHMKELEKQLYRTRSELEVLRRHDLRKGFTLTLLVATAVVWMLSLASVFYISYRLSRPIQNLTEGLHRLAGGDFSTRLRSKRQDEVGQALHAFNHTAEHLQRGRERLVYLTQVASWQQLARKMAHELKNSLTPIKLTVEEIVARHNVARHAAADRQFLEKAAEVVIREVESLERRVRAFSDFAAEPGTNAESLDINSILRERIQFLSVEHPDIHYNVETDDRLPPARADADQIKGILTNLLQNAAEAAGPGGKIRAITRNEQNRIVLEVHDSGTGLSEEARRSLFEPTISFKKQGMGLGLSIARKNALMAGGDLMAVQGDLGGACFRLELPFGDTKDRM